MILKQHTKFATMIGTVGLALCASVFSQQRKPLTNDDIIVMVHKKLPESVIVSTIQVGPAKFNTSPNELIRLNSAGLTEKELNAILAASGTAPASSPAAPDKVAPAEAADSMPPSKSRLPRVVMSQGSSSQEL